MTHTHWIVTNRRVRRKRADDGAMVERIVDDKREALPTFRIATFTPPAAAAPSDAELENAVELVRDAFPDRYERVRSTDDPDSRSGSTRLFLALYQGMCDAEDGKGDTLFFLHGFNYSYPDALRHLHRLHKIYVEPAESPIGRIVYFTWPSWGSLRRYKKDQAIAQPSGLLLGRFFAKSLAFHRDFFTGGDDAPRHCGRKVHVAAHSMGNLVFQEFMRSIREYDFLRQPIFGQTLLLNADADWDSMEDPRPMSETPEFTERVHIYTHSSDDALLVSEATKNNRKRLGRHGPRDLRTIPPRTVVADCSGLRGRVRAQNVDDPILAGAMTALTAAENDDSEAVAERVLESTRVSTKECLFDHWGYLHRPEVIADVYRVLKGESSSRIPRRRDRGDNRYCLEPIGK